MSAWYCLPPKIRDGQKNLVVGEMASRIEGIGGVKLDFLVD
jgi:hypothetical protein